MLQIPQTANSFGAAISECAWLGRDRDLKGLGFLGTSGDLFDICFKKHVLRVFYFPLFLYGFSCVFGDLVNRFGLTKIGLLLGLWASWGKS